jgi:hypothetical protein
MLFSPRPESMAAFWPRLIAVTIQLIVYGVLGIWLVNKGIAKVRREGLVQVPPA